MLPAALGSMQRRPDRGTRIAQKDFLVGQQGCQRSEDCVARKVMAARVIPWGNQYGVAVVFERGNHLAYPVGNREEAERLVKLMLDCSSDVGPAESS
jgi:hypothetical protein